MAHEILTIKLANIEKELNDLEEKFNKTSDESVRIETRALIDSKIDDYAEDSKKLCYEKAADQENALLYLVKEYFYPVKKVKEERVKATGKVLSISIEDADKPIDIVDARTQITEKLGVNSLWYFTLEKLNYLLAVRTARRIGNDVYAKILETKPCYAMNAISRDISVGKTPDSNTQILKMLEKLIAEMFGDGYKVSSHHVNTMLDNYSIVDKKSKTNVNVPTHRNFAFLIKFISHNIVNNYPCFGLACKEIDDEKMMSYVKELAEAEKASAKAPAETASEAPAENAPDADKSEEKPKTDKVGKSKSGKKSK